MATSKARRPSFSSAPAALQAVPYSVIGGDSHNFDLLTSSKSNATTSSNDPPFLYSHVRSIDWLERHGLQSQKLTFDQILQKIGFKRVEGYNSVVGKTITAKYAGNLYNEVQQDNGDRYVLTCRPEKLREYIQRLEKVLYLLRKRLNYLTSGSRRLFGMIVEPSICLICDCKTFDIRLFSQFQAAVTSLLKEQITKIKKFNIVWVSNDNEQFREQPIDVNATNIDRAIDWICDRKCPRSKISSTATCEAVLKAFNSEVDSYYLISEGNSSEDARETLRDNVVKTRLSTQSTKPFNVVSLFCHDTDTQAYLRSIAKSADGSYFCYKINSEFSDWKAPANAYDPTRIKLQDDKLQSGTSALSPTAEYPIDIAVMYKEIIQCQSIIDRIEKILGFVRDETRNCAQPFTTTNSSDVSNASSTHHIPRSVTMHSSALFSNEENGLGSLAWLKLYGIDAQKLDFFSVLLSAAFRHCDGVVRVLKPPGDTADVTDSTPANPQDKLINAIYCDQFAHVAWPDGTIRHVHVTPELHRDYERRLRALLEKIRARLQWLRKGSRDVFGAILENNIYILIDTSKSMQHHLSFVKGKLRLLINDQLATKERVNLVAFNTVVNPWRDRLTKIADSTLSSQLQSWIDGLTVEGSTNTLGALRFALADPATEAIYLLTDGRPDQNERHILSQVQYRQTVPIHTIAFNCQDGAANQFLCDLSKLTGGRFHTFQQGYEKQTTVEIPESEDVGSLKRELMRGEDELRRVAALRDECLGRAWSRDNLQPKARKAKSAATGSDSSPFASRSAVDFVLPPASSTLPRRTNKKRRSTAPRTHLPKSSSATDVRGASDLLNTNPGQWLLPETQDYLHKSDPKGKSASDTEADHPQEAAPDTAKARTAYDDVKTYLKKNSLVAKALTIFDVIHPTSVTVKAPRHIQVIDRSVLSKVWDDILPLAYGSYVGKLRPFNHYAVDLEPYEKKLKALLADYHRFTSGFVWKHLDNESKKAICMRNHWNGLSKDEQNRLTEDINKEEYTSQSALDLSAWRKLSDDEQNDLLNTPVVYQDDNQAMLKGKLEAAGATSALEGVKRMDVEIQRAIKFLQISADLRQLQKRADVDSKASTGSKPKISGEPPARPRNGQRVISRLDDDGFFYPGTEQQGTDGRTMVRFRMGVEQNSIGSVILPVTGAISQPKLFVGDHVLVCRMRDTPNEFWTPGTVLCLPSPDAHPPRFYCARIFSPAAQDMDAPRRDLMKISSSLFDQTLIYLRNLRHGSRTTEPEDRVGHRSSDPSIEEAIKRQIQPLTDKIDRFQQVNTDQYNNLADELKDHGRAIRKLQKHRERPRSVNGGPNEPNGNPEPFVDFIEPNTPVYAVCVHYDNLVYQGTVMEKLECENSYWVAYPELSIFRTAIPREHIFLRSQGKRLSTIKPRSFAFVQFPNDFRGCWQPAAILEVDSTKSSASVRFYDCEFRDVPLNSTVIPISEQQFADYTTRRIKHEKTLLHQSVVAFNKNRNVYMLGELLERAENGHKFLIEWADGSPSTQQEEKHFFTAFCKPADVELESLVLALNDDQYTYRVGKVKSISHDRQTLTVRFADATNNRERDVSSVTTFRISDTFNKTIIQRKR